MKNYSRKSYFNIIEVALAMAIIGLGMTSIMALFPIGINASRSAISNTAATEVAEEFMGYVKSFAETSVANYQLIEGGVATLTDANDLRTDLTKDTVKIISDDITCDFLTDLKADVIDGTSDYTSVTGWDNLFKSTSKNALYIAIQRPDKTSLEATDPVFSAAVIIWKTDVNYAGSGGGDGADAIVWPPAAMITPTSSKTAGTPGVGVMTLNIELSWPLSKLYKDREKKYFQTIIIEP